MAIEAQNRLREIMDREGIETSRLASAARINERVLTRIATVDGAPRLEIKQQLVDAINTLVDEKRYKTGDVFSGWESHRRNRKSKKKSGNTPPKNAEA